MLHPLTFDIDDYMQEVEQGYVTRRLHPEDSDVVILNYTPKTVYERRWNNVTLSCRGLIINERTRKVLAKSMDKFFNYDESGVPNKVDLTKQPEITVKMDGSLGISYRLDDGKLRWATRGSFVSEQAKVAQKIWDERYSHCNPIPVTTLLVEIISPATRVVVPYDYEDLVLIGMVDKEYGYDYSYSVVKYVAESFGMRVTERVNGSIVDIFERAKTLNYTEEGFVLRWDDGTRLKIKGQDYMRVHKTLYGLSLNHKLEFWLEDKMDDLIQSVPEEYRNEIEELNNRLDTMENDTFVEVGGILVSLQPIESRKEFALRTSVYIPRFRTLLFLAYDKKLTRRDIKRYVIQKYKEEFTDAE